MPFRQSLHVQTFAPQAEHGWGYEELQCLPRVMPHPQVCQVDAQALGRSQAVAEPNRRLRYVRGN